MLALVVCALVVALAYPTRQYIAQQSKIAEQREQAEQAGKRVEQLREEKARWQDPEHVRAEAREHLHFVLPGETGYTIVDPDSGMDVQRSSSRTGAGRPWHENLWDGIDAADRADARGATPAPR